MTAFSKYVMDYREARFLAACIWEGKISLISPVAFSVCRAQENPSCDTTPYSIVIVIVGRQSFSNKELSLSNRI